MNSGIIFALLMVVSFSCFATETSYTITSWSGKAEQISINEDHVNNLLTVSSLYGRLAITGFTDLKYAKRMGKHFLTINYSVRGGSGVSIENLLIVSVADSQLLECLHLNSMFLSDFDETYDEGTKDQYDEHEKFDMDIAEDSMDDTKLSISYRYSNVSKFYKSSVESSRTVLVNFNKEYGVFQSTMRALEFKGIYYDPGNEQERSIEVEGTFPSIILYPNKYYFIKGYWVQIAEGNYMHQYAIKMQ